MTTKPDIVTIADYALQDRDNLVSALKLIEAADEIRSKIVQMFLKNLEASLLKELNEGWRIENELKNKPLEKYQMFGMTKKTWPRRYVIGINAENNGLRNFLIGIRKPVEGKSIPELDKDVKDVLDKEIQPSQPGVQNWCWWNWCENKYRHFDDIDVLTDFYFRKEGVEWFSSRLLGIKSLTEAIFDKYAGTVAASDNSP